MPACEAVRARTWCQAGRRRELLLPKRGRQPVLCSNWLLDPSVPSCTPQVQGQEREANEQAAAAKAMAEDAQRDLDAALPALDAAVASLKNLSRCGAA